MVWKVTVTPAGPCGVDTPTGECDAPATTKVIDDNGVHRRTVCQPHAEEFAHSLRGRR
jgi:hypothetical protein